MDSKYIGSGAMSRIVEFSSFFFFFQKCACKEWTTYVNL